MRDYLRHVAAFSAAARLFLIGEFLSGIGQGTLHVLRNLYLKDCGLEEGFIGQTLSVASLGTLLVAVPLAFFMDRGPLKAYLIAGALAFAAGMAGTALWPARVPLLVSSFVAGAGGALLGVGAAPFYMRNSTPQERPYLFGVGMALGPAAGFLGTALVGGLALIWGEGVAAQRHILLVAAVVSALGVVVFLFIREAGAPAPRRERQEFDRRTATKLCLPGFVIGLGAGLTIPFINLYFRQRFEQGPATVSAFFSAAQILTFFAFLAAPVLARRFGGVRTVVACQLLSIPFFLAMAFTLSPALAVAAFLARHALMNMAAPVASNFAMEVVPPEQRALTNGLREVTWDAAWMLAASVGGWAIQHARVGHDGFTLTMLVTIGLYIVGSVLYWAFWRRSTAMVAVRAAVVPETH